MNRRTPTRCSALSPLVRLFVAWVGLLAVVSSLSCSGNSDPKLLNVSYDATRELYKQIKTPFCEQYKKETGKDISIEPSHGGSSSQAQLVVSGLEADVVTLALWSDIDLIQKAGLIREGWEKRLPDNSLPYYSTIVMVVRRGTPKEIRDWPDLIKPGVEVIVPNPKMSGNGKLAFLSAWGWAYLKDHGGPTSAEAAAREFTGQLFKHVQVRDTGARLATVTFGAEAAGRRASDLGKPAADRRLQTPKGNWKSSIRRSAFAPSPMWPSSIRTSINMGRGPSPRRI